ncbi:MAG: helix-turn-helix domain-containing protein [Lentisphaeria bacterium]|nr:helix-turn-helix domain-containing protein [Lentisphaeria bacterium]
MRIDDRILQALRKAVAQAGDAKELAAKCQVSASNISRYLSGKVKSITDDCWEKLQAVLELPPLPATSGTIKNSAALREFIRQKMAENGMNSTEQLRRAIGYDSQTTINRLFNGELNWFPDVLSAVFDVLNCDPADSPLSGSELSMLSPRGLYRDGAMLVRPVPVVEWANAASHLESLESDNVIMQNWDPDTTLTVPVPADSRRDTRAFKVHGISMEPRILDDDIVLVEPAENLNAIPDNKVVVVRFSEQSNIPEKVVCKRLRKQSPSQMLLTSDNPEGRIIPCSPDDIAWIGIVVKKISEM